MSDDIKQIAPDGVKNYKSNPNLKGSGVTFVFTRHQIRERVKCMNDPLYFIEKYIKIVNVDKGLVPFKMYDFQKDLLRSYVDNRFTIAKLPRQVGKTTVTIGYIMWTVLFGPMQNIAILANKASTARDILAKLALAYEHIPLWMQQGIVSWNKGSIELENGSKVIAAATASSSARGNTYNCVSGTSKVKVRIDGEATELPISELYTLIAASPDYRKREVDSKETQYVHRKQIQEAIHEDSSDGLFTSSRNKAGETPHSSQKHGWLKLVRKFSEIADKASHYMSQATDEMRHTRTPTEHDLRIRHDDSHEKVSKNIVERVSILERLFAGVSNGQGSECGNQKENISCQQGQTEGVQTLSPKLPEHLYGLDGKEKERRARCESQSKSRQDTQDGRETSWHEKVRRESIENEFGSKGSRSLEQGENWCLFFRNTREDESCKNWKDSNGAAQKQFEKIEVLTEDGYKDFHGVKRTRQQKTIKLVCNNTEIVCTPDHKLFTEEGYVVAKHCLKKKILNHDGRFYEVTSIYEHTTEDVYDLLEVSDTHSYFCNGFLSHQCIFLDEFAFVPKNIAEEFITSVYPTISSGNTTKVIMVSTPNGMNLFYKYWTDAVNGRNLYKPIEAHWSVVPGRDAKWADDQIRQLGQEKFDQEFQCSFLGSASTLISTAKLSTLAWKSPEHKISELDIYEQAKPGNIYILAADTAEGQGLDYSAFVVMDCTQAPYKVVAKYYNNKISPMLFPNVILSVANQYNQAFVLVETNAIGSQVAEILHNDLEYSNVFSTTNMGRGGQKLSSGFKKNSKLGIKTTAQIKSIGCSNLKSLLESNKIIVEDFDIISELTSFVASGSSYAAEPGCNDDLTMCMVLFSWLTTQPLFKEMTDIDIRKKLYEEKMESISEQILPFGIIEDGSSEKTFRDDDGTMWEYVEYPKSRTYGDSFDDFE